MAEYYLISQLPSLDCIGDSAAVPITEERFFELCDRLLGKKAVDMLNKITLIPPITPKKTGCELIDRWNEGERALRLALRSLRLSKMNNCGDCKDSVSSETAAVARKAVEFENPMDAEKYLSEYRLKFLETLRPSDYFSRDYIYYYGLKLKLISRARQFDTKLGEEAYRNIYRSVSDGGKTEDIQ